MKKSKISLAIFIGAALVGCGRPIEKSGSISPPHKVGDTILTRYQKDGEGGFSPYWVAYILRPKQTDKDQAIYVSVNGKRLGPYENISGRMVQSSGGQHIAFAAKKGTKWVVVVDGVEKFTQEDMLWFDYAWSPDLEGRSFIPQTSAACMAFSYDGQSIAYPAKLADGKYAIFVDGKQGKEFDNFNSSLRFIGGKLLYCGIQGKSDVVVFGDSVLGTFDSASNPEVSDDHLHYAFSGTTGGVTTIFLDGTKVQPKDTYDEITELSLSPDGKNIAYWARKGTVWSVIAGDKTYPGFGGYFYYEGGQKYCLMWTPDSQHIAYFVRGAGSGQMFLDGQSVESGFTPGGLGLINIVDKDGTQVGLQLMNGPSTDPKALALAAVMRGKVKCDPFQASVIGSELCFIEKNGGGSLMHIGSKTEGPYPKIVSDLYSSTDGKHYAYVVGEPGKQQVVLDGALKPTVYDAIYRFDFDSDSHTFNMLDLKGGNLIHTVLSL